MLIDALTSKLRKHVNLSTKTPNNESASNDPELLKYASVKALRRNNPHSAFSDPKFRKYTQVRALTKKYVLTPEYARTYSWWYPRIRQVDIDDILFADEVNHLVWGFEIVSELRHIVIQDDKEQIRGSLPEMYRSTTEFCQASRRQDFQSALELYCHFACSLETWEERQWAFLHVNTVCSEYKQRLLAISKPLRRMVFKYKRVIEFFDALESNTREEWEKAKNFACSNNGESEMDWLKNYSVTFDTNSSIHLSPHIRDAVHAELIVPKLECCKHLYIPKTSSTTMLLYGLPGTGKTYAVKHIAKLMFASGIDCKLYSFTAADILDAKVGGSEQNLLRIFTGTLQEPQVQHILFFDECEILLRARASSNTSSMMVQSSLVNMFLQLLDGSVRYPNTIVIFATNYPTQLDSAILSRVDMSLKMNLPTDKERQQLVQDVLERRVQGHPINIAQVLTKHISDHMGLPTSLSDKEDAKVVKLFQTTFRGKPKQEKSVAYLTQRNIIQAVNTFLNQIAYADLSDKCLLQDPKTGVLQTGSDEICNRETPTLNDETVFKHLFEGRGHKLLQNAILSQKPVNWNEWYKIEMYGRTQ